MSFEEHNGEVKKDISYKPEEGNLAVPTLGIPNSTSQGYFNLPKLRQMLEAIINDTNENIRLAETYLASLALKVEENSRLEKAQAQEWPATLGGPKSSITYTQYKAMRKLNTRSSDYIVKQYEKYARGPSGNHNVDLVLANELINNEATYMLEFLDNNLGSVTHTSEYRTIEIFQDWAQDATTFTGNLRAISRKGAQGQHTESIPEAELGKINNKDAVQFQTLFKTKVNSFNEQIAQLLGEMGRDINGNSKIFYHRFLGPTLKFELELSPTMSQNASLPTFLGLHARKGEASFGWQFEQLLVDALKRNENFRASMQGLMLLVDRRDDYNGFIQQLQAQGSQVKQFFVDDDLSTDEKKAFEEIVQTVTEEALPIDEEFVSDHNALDNLLADNAHPQYLLKKGDKISGDIEVEEGVTIDGVDINTHEHDGTTTPKIKGKNIEGGTLGPGVIDTAQRPDPPRQLKIKRVTQDTIPPGFNVFDVTISWVGNPNHTFEVQVAPYNEMQRMTPYDD